MTVSLDDVIAELRVWLRSHDIWMPAAVALVEMPTSAGQDAFGRALVATGDLVDIGGYAARFDALLAEAPAWINVSFVGAVGDLGIVTVEGSALRIARPRSRPLTRPTSINFSGPPRSGVNTRLSFLTGEH